MQIVKGSFIAVAAGGFVLCGGSLIQSVAQTQVAKEVQTSIEAFRILASVLNHPRCQNCHTATGYPRQGDDRHRHSMNVQRGKDGEGAAAQRCSTCHGRANNVASGVPGADENWHLAPLSMGWENRSFGELCRGLIDPRLNGGRNGAKIIEHLPTPLVKWAWDPGPRADGEARTSPSVPYAEFVAAAERWVATGLACPD
jgi:mono/diheme cytochrome c family protein